MVNIFVDGSGSRKGTPGGWAYVVVDLEFDDVIYQRSGSVIDTTSNRMELTAFIECLKFLKEYEIEKAVVWTDSMYVEKGCNEWLENWKLLNFVHTKNDDLWRLINRLIFKDKVNCKVKWMKGHQKDEIYNNMADKLAGTERASIVKSLKK